MSILVKGNGRVVIGPRTFLNEYSIVFDGADDYISMGNVFNKDGSEPYSISTWINYTASGTRMIVSKQDANPGGFLLHSGVHGTNRITWYPATNAEGYIGVRTTNSYNDGNWHHILATYDGSKSASGAKIYVDGILDSSTIYDTFSGTAISSTGNVQISGRNGTQFCYAGSQDEVAIFNSDQSANVTNIYNGGVPGNLNQFNPASWWRMGDSDNYPTITDKGSEGNNGTMTNMDASDIENNVPS